MKSSDHRTHSRILEPGAVLALLFGCATKSDTITGQWQSPRETLVELAGRVNADAVIVTRMLHQSFMDGRTADPVVTYLGPEVSISHNESTNSTVVVISNVGTEIVPGSFALDTEDLLEWCVYKLGKDGQLAYRATMNAQFELSPDQRIEMAAAVFADKIARCLRKDGVIR